MKEQLPNDAYKRVACTFYDQLEAYGVQNKTLQISYYNNEKQLQEATIRIKDLQTKNKEEFLITTTDIVIRLDKIQSIQVQ